MSVSEFHWIIMRCTKTYFPFSVLNFLPFGFNGWHLVLGFKRGRKTSLKKLTAKLFFITFSWVEEGTPASLTPDLFKCLEISMDFDWNPALNLFVRLTYSWVFAVLFMCFYSRAAWTIANSLFWKTWLKIMPTRKELCLTVCNWT